MKNKTNKDLAQVLSEKISTPIYDALCDLYRETNNDDAQTRERQDIVNYEIENCLDYLSVDSKDFSDYKEQQNDFWNDKNAGGPYWCDLRSEYADSQTSIYNYNLWKNAPIISDWIEDAVSEFGSDTIKDRGITGLFAQGEYYFYECFCSEVLDALKDYINEEEE